MELKITQDTNNILCNYDADNLLNTISKEYTPNPVHIQTYAKKAKLLSSPIDIEISETNQSRLNAISKNLNNIPVSLIFNFLIENIIDCSKIQPKKIAHALKNYYKLVVNHSDPVCSDFLSSILDGYAHSGFYNEEIGLNEEDIANFLTVSKEGQSIIEEIDKLMEVNNE